MGTFPAAFVGASSLSVHCKVVLPLPPASVQIGKLFCNRYGSKFPTHTNNICSMKCPIQSIQICQEGGMRRVSPVQLAPLASAHVIPVLLRLAKVWNCGSAQSFTASTKTKA
eukprot:TRINITY_DN805_c0_g3_i2.p1 TRINITY_DN805_c0_g3~~TRINITY_DN805_c0_g3_i2.p1  ORF type:complete len:112 (+),score=14.30 TRINITY_DN805_c0_g3_i2:306-641(+)